MIVESKGKKHELPDSLGPELARVVYSSKVLALGALEFWETIYGSVPDDLGKELTLMYFQMARDGRVGDETEL